MYQKIILITSLTLLLFTSCSKEIEYKGNIKPPILVLNGYLTPDSTVKVNVSKTRFLFTTTFDKELNIETASVKLYANDNYVEQLTHTIDGTYTGHYKPQIADKIKIKVSAEGFESIEATTQIPNAPNVSLMDTIEILKQVKNAYENTVYNRKEIRIRLKLNDENSENYYYCKFFEFLSVKEGETNDYRYIEYPVKAIAFLEIPQLNNNNTEMIEFTDVEKNSHRLQNVFDDQQFNGKEIKLNFFVQKDISIDTYDASNQLISHENLNNQHSSYTIQTAQMSKEMYLFLFSSEKARQISTSPFAEGVQVYSNVKNGTGILASYTTKDIIIK